MPWGAAMTSTLDPQALNALADRLEQAAGPDRELDAAIAVALKFGARGILPDDHEYLSMPDKRDPGPGVTAGHYWFHCRSGMSLRSAPLFTVSPETRQVAAAILRVLRVADWYETGPKYPVEFEQGRLRIAFDLRTLTAAALRAIAAQSGERP